MSEQSVTARDEGARLLQAGDLAGAQQRLLQALQENPVDARAHTYLGICKTRLGDPSGGIVSLQEAVRLAPADAVFRYNLGVALSQAGRNYEARAELSEAMRLNPAHAGARELLHRLQSAPDGAVPPPPVAPPPTPVVPPQPQFGTAPPQEPTNWTPPDAPLAGQAPPAPPGWTPPAPSVPLGGQPDAAPGAWSPAPVPGQSPAGWTPAPGAPQPGSWSPAPQVPGGPQQDAYTGSPAAMYYAQDQMAGGEEPGLGKRLLRGWLWGTLYGQWWTLWTVVSMFIWGGASMGAAVFVVALLYALGYGFFGSLVGLIIGAANLDDDQAVYVGVGAGLIIMGLEFLLFKSPSALINIVFYFFTGRYIGRGIAGRVQQPV